MELTPSGGLGTVAVGPVAVRAVAGCRSGRCWSWRCFRSFAGWAVGVEALSVVGIIAVGAVGDDPSVVYCSRERRLCYRFFYSLLPLSLYMRRFLFS